MWTLIIIIEVFILCIEIIKFLIKNKMIIITIFCILLRVVQVFCLFNDESRVCTLSDLYKSDDILFAVTETVDKIFDIKFDEVIVEAKRESPYLVNPAYHFHNKIKNYFIEEGIPLNNIRDLELILKKFEYLSIPNFREQKIEYERNRNG